MPGVVSSRHAQSRERSNRSRNGRALLEAIADTAASLLAPSDLDAALDEVLRSAGRRIGASRAFFFEYGHDEQGRTYASKRHEWSARGVVPAADLATVTDIDRGFDGPLPFARLAAGHSVSVPVKRARAALRHIMESLGTFSVLIVPVFAASQWWGALVFDDCKGERSWSPNEIQTAEAVARLVGAAIAREQKTRTVTRRDALLGAVAASATVFLQPLEVGSAIPRVLELVGGSTHASRAYLFRIIRRKDGGIHLSDRYEWDAPGIAPARGDGLVSDLDEVGGEMERLLRILAHGDPITVRASGLPGPIGAMMQRLAVKSVAAVPVFADGRWWGILGFDDCGDTRLWSSAELDAAKTLAAMIGAALDRARTLADLAAADRIVQSSPTMLFRLQGAPEYPLTFLSRNVRRIGYGAADLMAAPTDYWRLLHPDDGPRLRAALAALADPAAGEERVEVRLRAKDGDFHWMEVRLDPTRRSDGALAEISGTITDVSERKLAEERLARISRTDALTGLLNRTAFMEHLAQACASARRDGNHFAVLYLDLDLFKDINDVLGHPAGDDVLRAVASRVAGLIRETDSLARVGGDEFAVLQSDVTDPSDAATLAGEILQAVDAPLQAATHTVNLTASIGIATYGGPLSTADEMMKQADLALYRAKEAGRNRYHFHVDALDVEIRERVTLAQELRTALERHQLELYYQPQVDLATQRIAGMEALLRWNHPTRGLVLPSTFIHVAEKTGSIRAVGTWVLTEACRQMAAWHAEHLAPPVIGINVSAAQLREPGEFEWVLMRCMDEGMLVASQFEIELTESVLMETTREHSDTLARLSALGVRIAIDDFGTGYSSLEYLRAYHVNRLKIAGAFIHDVTNDPNNQAIVRAALSLARELGIEVVAEAVETADQLRFLQSSGSPVIQGYYFSPPLPARQAGELLRHGTIDPGGAAWRTTSPITSLASTRQ